MESLTLHNSAGEVLTVQYIPELRFGHPSYNGHRGELHEALYYYAKALGVEIRLGQDVSEYWEDEQSGLAGVITNGERLSADVVIGADGVRSRARTLVLVGLRRLVCKLKITTCHLSRDMKTNRSHLDMRYTELGLTRSSRGSTRTL